MKQFVHIEDSNINRNFDKQIDHLTGKQNTMGIIEAIKQIEREDAFEKGVEKGIEKGMEKGIEKGMEKGKKKGIEKGMEKGIEKGKTEVVTILINTGNFTISQIANFANVPESFVRRIKKEDKK